MARPRRPFSGQTTVRQRSDAYAADVAPVGYRASRRWGNAQRHLAYPVPNGVYDPLTYFFTLHALLNIDTQVELQAARFVEFLNAHYPALRWDSVTVGRVLSDMCDSFEEALGEKQGLLIRGRSYKGYFYLVNDTVEAVSLARSVLDDLHKLSRVAVAAAARDTALPRVASPLLDCRSFAGERMSDDEAEAVGYIGAWDDTPAEILVGG